MVNVKGGKTLNHLIHMEEQIIRFLKRLEDKSEIPPPHQKKKDLYPSGSKPSIKR